MTNLTEDHEDLIKFLTDKRRLVLNSILSDPDCSKYHVVSIHSSELLDVSLKIFTETVSDADKWLPILDKDVLSALDIIYDESEDKSKLTKKEMVHLRISALPAIPWFQVLKLNFNFILPILSSASQCQDVEMSEIWCSWWEL